jgi:hypothetical protein
MAEKWSQFSEANLPLTGSEIFAFGIEGDQSYQIDFGDLVSQVFGWCGYATETVSYVEIDTPGASSFIMDGGGGVAISNTAGVSLNLYSSGALVIVGGGNGSIVTDDSGNFTMNSGDNSVSMNLLTGGTVNLVNNGSGYFLEVTDSGVEFSVGTFVMNGQTGYTGTLASAAGRNVINGIIY